MKLTAAILVTFILIIFIVIFVNSQRETSLNVDIPEQGKVRGTLESTLWTKQSYMSFLGIPYAESPSGALRFMPPVAKRAWSHTWDATKFGQRCPVITSIPKMLPEHHLSFHQDLEDCLNLCVYTKNLKKLQPVMFYIYGGGFHNGSNQDHPPKYLLEKDIVLVVPNFRIGALGWLSDLSKELPGNLPLKDILLALQWVQKYIREFGGDPQNITIFGQSAGAAQTGALLLSPHTPKGIFKRAIMQSGSIFAAWAMKSEPQRQVARICQALNCASCKDEDVYKCLNKATVVELLHATKQEFFSPVVGDFYGVLPHKPSELIKNYTGTIPIMTGFTKDDGSFVLADYYDAFKKGKENISSITVRQFAQGLMELEKDITGISKNLLTRLLFPAHSLETTDHKGAIPAYFDLTSTLFMKSPIIVHSSEFLKKKNANTYLYSFDYDGENTRFGYEFGNEHYPFNGGVHHSNDNIYLFSTHSLNAEDTEISKETVSIWTSFAITGVPRTQSGVALMPMENENGPYFHINKGITIGYDVLQELTSAIDDPDNEKLIRPDIKF